MNFSEFWRTADCDLQNLHRGFESCTRLQFLNTINPCPAILMAVDGNADGNVDELWRTLTNNPGSQVLPAGLFHPRPVVSVPRGRRTAGGD